MLDAALLYLKVILLILKWSVQVRFVTSRHAQLLSLVFSLLGKVYSCSVCSYCKPSTDWVCDAVANVDTRPTHWLYYEGKSPLCKLQKCIQYSSGCMMWSTWVLRLSLASVRNADTSGVALVLINQGSNTRTALCSMINALWKWMRLKFSKEATGWHS